MMITAHDIPRQEDISGTLEAVRERSLVPAGTESAVRRIIEAVRERGDEALLEMTLRFDGVSLDSSRLEVSAGERRAAWEALDTETREALAKAESRIALFARESLPCDWLKEVGPGLTVGQTYRPLETVGLYVPGGRYPYPSTVLMTGVLAREAGVGQIVFCVPPGQGGEIDGTTLAATTLVGECRVFRAGGAQAIAAMAYGTGTIPSCRMIAGPGNVYVATAKRLLSSVVSIDLEAGPSEIAAYVDGSVDISYPAADMLAQLEHDPQALAVIVSEHEEVLESAGGVLSGLADGMNDETGARMMVHLVRCASPELSVEFLNELAPEHLELMVEDAQSLLPDIRSAGCVFIGPFSAVALGDYVAGPSHVLPTAGTAARLSGLNVGDFRRVMNVISYEKEAFDADAPVAKLLAGLEGLRNHALSLDVRKRP